jgi:hypothetical protein
MTMDAMSETSLTVAELDTRLRAVEARCDALTRAMPGHASIVATATDVVAEECGLSAGDALAKALASYGSAIREAAERANRETV